MTLKDDLETDIIKFFQNTEKQNVGDKHETLRQLLNKYIHFSKSTHMMDHVDLNEMINNAKIKYTSKTFPMFLGDQKRKVAEGDQAHICIIESTIAHLNKNECLNKLAKFDYKENKM
jgi:hypothetical protein